MSTTAVVVGNPQPQSRTLKAATWLATELAGELPDIVVDLACVGSDLMDGNSSGVAALVEQVGAADLVIVASPTYKGTYTGLVKLFLDRFPGGTGLRGLAVPFMLGASVDHSLAAELTLRPVLTELGATVPGRGLFVLESAYDDPETFMPWLAATRPIIADLTGVAA